jgi:hypothetical protein
MGLLCRQGGPLGLEPGNECYVHFADYAVNSRVLVQGCDTRDCCPYVQAFKMFAPQFTLQHLNDQSHCVFLPGGESLVDFVGATESVEEDWARVVQEINNRMGTTFVPGIMGRHNVGQGDAGQTSCASAMKFLNETSISNIAWQYSMDIVRFGYM